MYCVLSCHRAIDNRMSSDEVLKFLRPFQEKKRVNFIRKNSHFKSSIEPGLPNLKLSVFFSGISDEFGDSNNKASPHSFPSSQGHIILSNCHLALNNLSNPIQLCYITHPIPRYAPPSTAEPNVFRNN